LYLAKAQETAQETAHTVADMLKQGRSRDEIIQFIKDRFYQGYIREIYPVNAMELNTGITIDLIEREFGSI
jgi:cytochrome c-type biogenesis protein CcmH/NrfF